MREYSTPSPAFQSIEHGLRAGQMIRESLGIDEVYNWFDEINEGLHASDPQETIDELLSCLDGLLEAMRKTNDAAGLHFSLMEQRAVDRARAAMAKAR